VRDGIVAAGKQRCVHIRVTWSRYNACVVTYCSQDAQITNLIMVNHRLQPQPRSIFFTI